MKNPYDSQSKVKEPKSMEDKSMYDKNSTMYNKNSSVSKQPKKEFSDIEVTELKLYSENDYQLYQTSQVPIEENLRKKMEKGTYDSEKAVKLWKYHADKSAKKYNQEFGDPKSGSGYQIFTPADRFEVARRYRDDFEEEMKVQGVYKK